MDYRVTAFTDAYLPTVNGVTYTVNTWRDRWHTRGGIMDIVYPGSSYPPVGNEFPVRSIPFPLYDGFRLGSPVPPAMPHEPDLVHVHTPFSVGIAGRRLARARETPLIASYHTPTGEYASYLSPMARATPHIRRLCHRYERWFYDTVDVIITPTDAARRFLENTITTDASISIISNGVDIDLFRPIDPTDFLFRYDLDSPNPLIGYTGRHGYEKRLTDLVAAVEPMDVTLLLAGDGPARKSLEHQAKKGNTDIRFLGFLDRDELPAFYSALDVFAFPSPVETQGLVALEANACGTPVVGPDSNGLTETIVEGKTGIHYRTGHINGLRRALSHAIADRCRLSRACIDRRDSLNVDHSIDRLQELYEACL